MTSLAEPASRRASRRFKWFEPAEIETCGVRCRAHVLDVSLSGACLHCAAEVSLGAIINLHCRDWTREAQVRWVEQSMLGIAFAAPLSPRQLRLRPS